MGKPSLRLSEVLSRDTSLFQSQSTGIDKLSITVKGAQRSNTSQSKLVSLYTCIFDLFSFYSFQGGIIAWTARPVCADSGSTVSSPNYEERLRWCRWLFGQEIYRGTPDRPTDDWKRNCRTKYLDHEMSTTAFLRACGSLYGVRLTTSSTEARESDD